MRLGLYIHIPFCLRRCYYCSFNSFVYQPELVSRYLRALEEEISVYSESLASKGCTFETIYIGGGTPTCLDGKQISQIIESCRNSFKIEDEAEITIEANPGTINEDKVQTLRAIGINRISLGVQSFDDSLLKKIGRIHTSGEAVETFHLLRENGFGNINIDLIFGLPGQDLKVWEETLNKAVSLNPVHFSVYNLMLEEGSEFYKQVRKRQLDLPDEDCQLEMYEMVIKELKRQRYKHYEISSFALPSNLCKHNQIYWRNNQYLGLGVSASSYLSNNLILDRVDFSKFKGYRMNNHKIRYSNVNDIHRYIDLLNNKELPIKEGEILDKEREMGETMMLGLRMMDGVDINEFRDRFGVSVFEIYSSSIDKLRRRGLITVNDERIKLTHKGLLFSNDVFLEFLM